MTRSSGLNKMKYFLGFILVGFKIVYCLKATVVSASNNYKKYFAESYNPNHIREAKVRSGCGSGVRDMDQVRVNRIIRTSHAYIFVISIKGAK